MRLLGIVLVILGIVGLTYGGISWTRQEEVLDVGPVELSRQQRETLPITPLAGGLCLAAGVVLLVMRR